MAWQPQLWAGSTRGTNLCVWPRHWCLASPVSAYRSCFFLEISLDLVKAALRLRPCPSQCGGPNLEGLDVKACTVTRPRDRANWQWLPGRLYLKTAGLEWVGLFLESLQMANPNVRQSPRRGDDPCFPQSSASKWRENCDVTNWGHFRPFCNHFELNEDLLVCFLVKGTFFCCIFSERNIFYCVS